METTQYQKLNELFISGTFYFVYTTRQNFLNNYIKFAQDLSVECASELFERSHNTSIFEMIARFQFSYRQTYVKRITRRELLKSALNLRLKKRRFEICVRFHEKLLLSDLRLLLLKKQYSSDVTSKVRIWSLTPNITKRTSIKSKGG